jgi:hypothetical protein
MASDRKNFNNGFVHQIDKELYLIEIYFYNSIENPVSIPFYMVDSLTINESLINWWITGNIVLNNINEITQRNYSLKNEKKINHLYIDRTDGRNRINIRIIPLDSDKHEYEDKQKWEMSYDLVVYDIEDLPSDNIQNKLKRYYFIDERYQIFSEKNIEWSTATAVLNMPGDNPVKREDFLIDDTLRNLNPNIALAELLKFASQNDGEPINVGFSDSSAIDKPNIKLGDIQNWNMGSKDITNIFYTSPAYFNVIDDINFLQSRCIGDNNDPVFLEFGRNTENKFFYLASLTDILKDSSNQIERLILDENPSGENSPYIPRAFIDEEKDNKSGNNYTSVYSRISKYKFTPMAPIDDTNNFINSPLHYFDSINGQFNIIYEGNSIQSTIKRFEDISKNTLYSFTKPENKPHLLTNINKTKANGVMISNKYLADPYVNENISSIYMMRDFIFLNQTLSFQQKGLTFRTPGKFVFVDSIISGDNNPFDDRFLGQWLITSVTHLFTKNEYVTEVVANKIDTHSKIWDIEDKNS